MVNPGDIVTLRESDLYTHQVRAGLVRSIGDNGAWLLLSIAHYGWRARFDLSNALVSGSAVATHDDIHLTSCIDLEVQASLYGAVDQLCRLIRAAESHLSDRPISFFDAYTRAYDIPPLVARVAKISAPEFFRIFGLKREPEGMGTGVDSVIAAALDEIHVTLSECQQLVSPIGLDLEGNPVPQGHSLRTVDNAFRHGLKILLHDALPRDRKFRAAVTASTDPLSPFAIDLHQSREEPQFATVDASPERTLQHLASVAVICIRIKQVALGLISRFADHPSILISLPGVSPRDLGLVDSDPPTEGAGSAP